MGVLILYICLYYHDKYWGKSQLAADNAKLTMQLNLAETRLAPFTAIALEKYPGRWEDALSKLADDIHRFEVLLKRAENRIRSLEIEVTIEFTASWKDNKFPKTSEWIMMGAGEEEPSAEIDFVHDNNTVLPVRFKGVKDYRLEDLGNGKARIFYRCTGESRSPVFDARIDEIHRCKRAVWRLAHITSNLLEPKPMNALRTEIEILANNQTAWSMVEEKGYHFPVLEAGRLVGYGTGKEEPWELHAGPLPKR